MRYYQEFPFFIGFIVLLLASLKVDAVDQNYINQLVPRMSTLDRESVVKNEYGYSLDEVIQELRERDNEYTASHSRLLVRLRDVPTIEKYVSLFVASEGANPRIRGLLLGSYSPWVIPLVVEHMDTHEDISVLRRHPAAPGAVHWGLSGNTAKVIRGLLINSNEFPPETRMWAEGLPSGNQEALKDLRDTLMVWWEENEAHFESEEYHLVRPVSWDLEEDAERNQEEERDLESTQESEEQDLGLEEEESEESRPPQSSDEEPEMEKSGRSPWPWVLGAAVVMVIAVGGFRIRLKGSGS